MNCAPVVEEVLRFEEPAAGRARQPPSRRALEDGTVGECARWYADEALICEGDLIGKTADQIRALHFRRDRDWLQS